MINRLPRFSTKRGAMLLEAIIATAIFALAMVTMSMMFLPIVTGPRTFTYQPHIDRMQMETFSRKLDEDFQRYRQIYAFEGEVQLGGVWVGPTALTLTAGTPVTLTRDVFLTRAGLTQQPNTASYEAHTLIFIGDDCMQDPSGNWIVYIDIVYRISAREEEDGITYFVERLRRDDGTPNLESGATDRLTFRAEGYTLADPDQPLPYFQHLDGGGIEVVVPNPFSKSVTNPATEKIAYLAPLKLLYNLKETGTN